MSRMNTRRGAAALTAVVLAFAGAGVAGCGDDAQDQIDKAVDDAGQQVQEGIDKADEETQGAQDAAGDAVDKADDETQRERRTRSVTPPATRPTRPRTRPTIGRQRRPTGPLATSSR